MEINKIDNYIEVVRRKMMTEYKAIFENSDMHNAVKIRNVYKI